jgi:hypothetical protein
LGTIPEVEIQTIRFGLFPFLLLNTKGIHMAYRASKKLQKLQKHKNNFCKTLCKTKKKPKQKIKKKKVVASKKKKKKKPKKKKKKKKVLLSKKKKKKKPKQKIKKKKK